MIKYIYLPIFILLLNACTPVEIDPGNQCLNSFKEKLKDPESGKVISFENFTLTYTATNSYGARIQGKALCKKLAEKWTRDTAAEQIKILNLTTDKLSKSNQCLHDGKKPEECAGDSLVLQRDSRTLTQSSINELQEESAKELGF